ncbi:hypothetical protein ABT173_49200 [Streptomyces sp. NPDC001795]|uniref:hypothetical protein n=1 Tax=Streptomyces sp. NPDC001795 TaxID=3154525 RepID=UPI0033200142
MAVKLRDHQIEAVAAIVRGLDIPPGGIPYNGLRGQVHAALGAGEFLQNLCLCRHQVSLLRIRSH